MEELFILGRNFFLQNALLYNTPPDDRGKHSHGCSSRIITCSCRNTIDKKLLLIKLRLVKRNSARTALHRVWIGFWAKLILASNKLGFKKIYWKICPTLLLTISAMSSWIDSISNLYTWLYISLKVPEV